jgi:hypothetical protein
MIVATVGAGGVIAWLHYGQQSFPMVAEYTDTIGTPTEMILMVWIGTTLGFVSHLCGDVITKGEGSYGVQPLWPLSDWESSIQLCNADDSLWNNGLFISGQVTTIAVILLKTSSLPL